MTLIDNITGNARRWVGEQEIQPNLGFKDPVFSAKMFAAGFYKGASWCAFFCIVVLFDAYAGTKWLPLLKKYCSGSTHQMWVNFKNSKEFITGQIPKPGCLVFWVEYGDPAQGHVGVCTNVEDNVTFDSVEGNTNSDGSRNGFEVFEHVRHKTNVVPHRSLVFLGCVYMPAA